MSTSATQAREDLHNKMCHEEQSIFREITGWKIIRLRCVLLNQGRDAWSLRIELCRNYIVYTCGPSNFKFIYKWLQKRSLHLWVYRTWSSMVLPQQCFLLMAVPIGCPQTIAHFGLFPTMSTRDLERAMGKKKKVREAESYRRCNNHFKNVKEEVVCACETGTS